MRHRQVCPASEKEREDAPANLTRNLERSQGTGRASNFLAALERGLEKESRREIRAQDVPAIFASLGKEL